LLLVFMRVKLSAVVFDKVVKGVNFLTWKRRKLHMDQCRG